MIPSGTSITEADIEIIEAAIKFQGEISKFSLVLDSFIKDFNNSQNRANNDK